MRSDQVSGRKNSAILSMMVWRMESRFRDEVRAFATSLKMATSCKCFLRSGTAASLISRTNSLASKGEKVGLWPYYMPSFFKSATHELRQKPESNSPYVPKTSGGSKVHYL